MKRYRVFYNSHQYSDFSDSPASRQQIVKAESPDDARDKLRAKEKIGKRYIGMIHQAEEIQLALANSS